MGKKRLSQIATPATPSDKKPQPEINESAAAAPVTTKPAKPAHQRSRRYRQVLTKIDRTKSDPLTAAISLLKQVSLTKFDASVEVHLNLTETGLKVTVAFPHSPGKSVTAAIADAKVLDRIQAGHIDFDVLLATPALMPQIAKVAKVLGPKGLMPNPKTGTVTADPNKKKAELEGGSRLVSGEPKSPLMHIVIGKLSFSDANLAANIQALATAVTLKRITKLTLASTMSPGIKVDLASLDQAVVK